MKARFAALLPLAAVLTTIACREEAVTRARVPKEAAAVPVEPARSRPRGLVWTLPAGWTQTPGAGMRVATFIPPRGIKAEATVVALPGESGGELANVNRWRGQIGLPPTDESGMAASRTTLKTKAGTAAVYDFTSAGTVRTRLIAAAVGTGGTTWFFKLVGEAGAAEAARDGFLTLVKGLAPDAAK